MSSVYAECHNIAIPRAFFIEDNMRIHYEWKCPFCPVTLNNRRDWFKHKKEVHNSIRNKPARVLADRVCQYCGYASKYMSSLKCHERYCILNPNRVEPKKQIIDDAWRERMRKQAIEGYKKGTFHGWMNCHSSKPSYPEKFFMKVIKNHFDDIHYKYNLMFYQYKLDFAWPHKKRCIEIDGSQHERNEKQKASDQRKDQKLSMNGWKVLRIRWVDMYHNPHEYIQQAKHFIDSGEVLTCEPYVNPSKTVHVAKIRNTKQKKRSSRKKKSYKSQKPRNPAYFLDKTGRANKNVLNPDIWKTRLNMILQSGVDLMQYGWVEKVHQKTGYTRRIIYKTINHFADVMNGKYFRR